MNRRGMLQLLGSIPFVGLAVPTKYKKPKVESYKISFQVTYDDLISMLKARTIEADRIVLMVHGDGVQVQLYGERVSVGVRTCSVEYTAVVTEPDGGFWIPKEFKDRIINEVERYSISGHQYPTFTNELMR